MSWGWKGACSMVTPPRSPGGVLTFIVVSVVSSGGVGVVFFGCVTSEGHLMAIRAALQTVLGSPTATTSYCTNC